MAKYGRFDPRNKKSGRNKYRSLERDIRIHETEKGSGKKEWVYEDSDDDDDSIQRVITIHDLSLLEDPAITAIDEMAMLEDGWLDGFGKAVSFSVRDAAKKFLVSSNRFPAFYAVAPTEEGGILLEYDHDGWDYGIEFNSDGTFCVFGIELDGSNEFSETFSAGEFKLFLSKVKETLGQ